MLTEDVTHLDARQDRNVASLTLQRTKDSFTFQLDFIRAAHQKNDSIANQSHVKAGVQIQRGHNVHDQVRLEARGRNEDRAVRRITC